MTETIATAMKVLMVKRVAHAQIGEDVEGEVGEKEDDAEIPAGDIGDKEGEPGCLSGDEAEMGEDEHRRARPVGFRKGSLEGLRGGCGGGRARAWVRD